jgi:hypothetical protein
VDQRDREAWLLALAARVDDGRPIDWDAEEGRAGPGQGDVVRALRIVAEIAGQARPDQARQRAETIESRPVTEPLPTSPPPSDDEPVSDRYRSFTPSEPAEIRRKLLFGAALLLAMASVYSGLLGWGRVLQYGLAGLAVLVVLIALISGATGPPQPPRPEPPA